MNTDFTDDELALDAEIQEGEHTGSRAKDIFCNQWDSARIGLSTLQLLLQKKIIVSPKIIKPTQQSKSNWLEVP